MAEGEISSKNSMRLMIMWLWKMQCLMMVMILIINRINNSIWIKIKFKLVRIIEIEILMKMTSLKFNRIKLLIFNKMIYNFCQMLIFRMTLKYSKYSLINIYKILIIVTFFLDLWLCNVCHQLWWKHRPITYDIRQCQQFFLYLHT